MMNWLQGRIASFGHALRGIASLLASEPNARIHLLATILVVALGLVLDVSRGDWQALLLIVAVVWLAEGMNTALEHLADAAVPEFHPLVGEHVPTHDAVEHDVGHRHAAVESPDLRP